MPSQLEGDRHFGHHMCPCSHVACKLTAQLWPTACPHCLLAASWLQQPAVEHASSSCQLADLTVPASRSGATEPMPLHGDQQHNMQFGVFGQLRIERQCETAIIRLK